jgi:hypothetical protein
MSDRNTSSEQTSHTTLNHRQLSRLRNRPVARLLAGSHWVLKTWQMDLDCPPPVLRWVDQRFTQGLLEEFGRCPDLDAVHLEFATEQDPAVDIAGNEQFVMRLPLRQIGRTTLDATALLALQRCVRAEQSVDASIPGLTVQALFEWLVNVRWVAEYDARVRNFWHRHEQTWQMLARLSFLDGLARQYKRGQISRDGYALGLDALGLDGLPRHLAELKTHTPNHRSIVHALMLGDEPIPGVFHLKSGVTGHCFIHVSGSRPFCVEYISDAASWNPGKVLQALNASAWHRLHLDVNGSRLQLGEEIGDVFAFLSKAQRQFSIERHDTPGVAETLQEAPATLQDYLLAPLEPALQLVSALDYWNDAGHLGQHIPTPLGVANNLMRRWLKREHALTQDPGKVFVRYLRGTSITPWGHPKTAASPVLIVPDEKPVALGEALLQNFRENYPAGYDDEGGRWVVFTDTSGKGVWSEGAEIAVSAKSIEAYVATVDFADVMSRQLRGFWERESLAASRNLRSCFIGQALHGLKTGNLSRHAFDRVVRSLEEEHKPYDLRVLQWSAVGFQLSSGHLGEEASPACAGLLLLRHRYESGWILYQPGHGGGFVELRDRDQLIGHLRRSAADERWRRVLANYMPIRFQARFDFILEIWAGKRRPSTPVSDLRPWTDRLYNEAEHKARSHEYFEHPIQGSATTHVLERLRENSQLDADDSIVTSREISIAQWTRWVNRLQLLLAPLAMLLTPAAIAQLTASAASLALSIQAANLPGGRDAERRQVLIGILTLGLLQLGPATPGMLRTFVRLATPARALAVAQTLMPLRNIGSWLQHITHPRKTVLNPFFNGAGPLKNWQVAANTAFGIDPVRIWKLGGKFLLWTSHRAQARNLVVSSHGYYLPWSGATKIPNGTELRTYAPHGHVLIDPTLHKVVTQQVAPYSLLHNTHATLASTTGAAPGVVTSNRLLAGTDLPGHIKNYKLAKFQSDAYESYKDISGIVRNSQHAPWPGFPATAMDVLTVRNRFGVTSPSLEDLFNTLHRLGIHYDRILLVHCRCPAISGLMGLAPKFDAPHGPMVITP